MRSAPTFILCCLFSLLLIWPGGSAFGSGLLVPTDEKLPPLRITDHLVDVQIHDRIALTTVTQTFRNDTKNRLEATYIFPLPEEADLTNFQMTFNGKMVEGEVLPADEARQIYETIVRQAKDPGLIEFIGRRLLRMRVFPVEPESDTTVKVTYQQVLRPISEMRGYHYPLRTGGGAAVRSTAYGTVRFTVDLEAMQPIKNIWSPTHAVEIVREGERRAAIAYEARGGSLEDDFILLYSTDESDLGLSVIAHRPASGEPGFFLLLLSPKHLWPKEEYQPQDVVFVIDTSGSMSGEKIEQAKTALKYCVGQLDERDRFSVVRFSTGFDVHFPEVVPATAENRRSANAFIDSFRAAGGTNIDDTLEHVARMNPDDESRPFVVVFITDGRGNRPPESTLERLAAATEGRPSPRIFAFGVGHDVNTMFLDRLANDYAGRPVYVQPGENLELVLGDFFATISQPVLTNLQLDLPDIAATERFPVRLGDLYAAQQLTVAGRFSREATGLVRLRAMRNGQPVEYTWPNVAFTNTESATYVPPIWAGRKIAWMIDEIRKHGETSELIDEIVALSKEYGIQTPYSSWLVAPEGRPGRPGIPIAREVRRRLDFADAPGLNLDRDSRLRGRGGGGGGGGFGGGGAGRPAGAGQGERAEDSISFEEAEQAVHHVTGRAGTVVAQAQERLRRLESLDEGRLGLEHLALRRLAGRDFMRLGAFWVDSTIPEKAKPVYVLFASEAYFDIVSRRPDLREAFAAGRNLVTAMNDRTVLVILETLPEPAGEGGEPPIQVIQRISEESRELLGLDRRIEQ